MGIHELRRPERPHRNDPTPILKAAIASTSQDAQRYAQTGPKQHEDVCHLLVDEMLEELQIRGDL